MSSFAWLVDGASGADHGGLTGLGDDDHPQYLTEERAVNLFDSALDGYATTQYVDGYIGLVEQRRAYLSVGLVSLSSYNDNDDGSATFGNCVVRLHSTTSGNDLIQEYTVDGNTFVFDDGVTNYVVADYNDGSPIIRNITNVELIDESTVIPIYTVFRNGTELCILDWDHLALNLTNKLHQRMVKCERFSLQSGLRLYEVATRVVKIAGGVVWYGGNKITLEEFLSNADSLTLWYHSSGVWTDTVITQYNNSQYDNGTDLVSLTGNKYTVNWVYRGIESDKHAAVVLGSGDYNFAQAQASQPPNGLPAAILSHHMLVGRIIVKNGDDTATQIDSAFDVHFSPSEIFNHNDLANIDGGIVGEYYHFSLAQYNSLVGLNQTVSEHYNQQGLINNTIIKDLDGYVVNVMTDLGDIIYGGAGGDSVRLAVGESHTVLHGGTTPSWEKVHEDDFNFTDVTTANVGLDKHGLCPKLPGSSILFLNGEGNYVTPSGAVNAYLAQAFSSTTSVIVTHNFGAYPVVQIIDDSSAQIIPYSVVHNSLDQFTVTFSESTTGTVIASVGSPQAGQVKIVTDDYQILTTDKTVQCSSSGKTITLPDAASSSGLEFRIDNSSSGDIYLESLGGTIQDETTQTIPPDSCLFCYSDGTNWRIC